MDELSVKDLQGEIALAREQLESHKDLCSERWANIRKTLESSRQDVDNGFEQTDKKMDHFFAQTDKKIDLLFARCWPRWRRRGVKRKHCGVGG